MRFLKKKVNFTRSCALAQKVKFYALQMLKKQNLTHPRAAKLATLKLLLIAMVLDTIIDMVKLGVGNYVGIHTLLHGEH